MKSFIRIAFVLFLSVSLIFVSSCKKDEDDPDKTGLLTSHIWNFDDLTTSSTNSDVQLMINFVKALMTDATLEFTSGGSYTLTAMDESESGSWSFNTDETELLLDGSPAEILTLTSSVLEFKQQEDDEEYGQYTVTYRWVK